MSRYTKKRSGFACNNTLLVEIAILGFGFCLFMPALQAICNAGKDGFTVGEIFISVLLAGPVAILGFLMVAAILLEWGYEFFIRRPKANKEWQRMVNECSEKEKLEDKE